MNISVFAIGTRMPGWVEEGVREYTKRIPSDWKLEVIEVAMAKRGKSGSVDRWKEQEAEALLTKLDSRDYIVALDVRGKALSTEALAQNLERIRNDGQKLSLIIGGPDGLARKCLQQSDAVWSLSELTLPHPIVRIVIAEQLYRAISILNGHPYHR